MGRRLHPMANTPLGKAITTLYRHAFEPALGKPRLSCLGCGCTDDRACVGGCSWSQPGICSRCAPRTDSLLVRSTRADELVKTRALNSRLIGRTSFTVMSLALLSWVGNEQEAGEHRARLAEGLRLKSFTSVRMGKSHWTFDLVYRPPRDEPGTAIRVSWRLRTGAG